MDFTSLTRTVGDLISQIKNNNKLLNEVNKLYNPTFVEILEDLKENDKTLAIMLAAWYITKYGERELKMDNLISKIKNGTRGGYTYNSSSGCGSYNDSHC